MHEAPRILVIDDDESLTRMLELAFRPTLAEVVRHSRGYGALGLVAEHRPVVVILDVMMPGLDGPSVVELIRQDPELARTRVVLWSAMPKPELERKARAVGADGWIEKTLSPAALVDQIADWLLAWDEIDIRGPER